MGYRQVNTLSMKAASLKGEPSKSPKVVFRGQLVPAAPVPKAHSLEFQPASQCGERP